MQKVFKPLMLGTALVNPTVEFMLGIADQTNCALNEVSVMIDGKPARNPTPLVVTTNLKRNRSMGDIITDIAAFLQKIQACSLGYVRFESGAVALVDYNMINGAQLRAVFNIEEPTSIMFQI